MAIAILAAVLPALGGLTARTAASVRLIHDAAARGDNAQIGRLLRADPHLLNAPDEPRGCIPTRWTPLHSAISCRQFATARYLISKGADVNAMGAFKDTPLHLAASAGDGNMVKTLLSAGAKVNVKDYRGDTPLHKAENSKTAALLIQRGADIDAINTWGETPLRVAAINGRKDLVTFLIRKNARCTVQEAAIIGDTGRIQRILRKDPRAVNARTKKRQTPLHWALLLKHEDTANALLAAGASVRAADEDGITPLHYAIADDFKDVVTALLDKGALVNAGVTQGEYWATPLHAAVGTRNKGMAELLLNRGADVDVRRFGYSETPLHTAAACADAEIVNLLLSRGADANTREFNDGSGNTPLHAAVLHQRAEIAAILLKRGSDVNAIGENGETALHMAAGEERDIWSQEEYPSTPGAAGPRSEDAAVELVELLISKGADVNEVDAAGRTVMAHVCSRAIAAILAPKVHSKVSIFDAAMAGNVSRVTSLLKGDGRLVWAKDWMGRQPLHCAAIGGSEEAARILLTAGANPNTADSNGRTPLHWAAAEGSEGVLRLLLEQKADVKKRDREKLIPLELAAKNGHRQIADLLRGWNPKH